MYIIDFIPCNKQLVIVSAYFSAVCLYSLYDRQKSFYLLHLPVPAVEAFLLFFILF